MQKLEEAKKVLDKKLRGDAIDKVDVLLKERGKTIEEIGADKYEFLVKKEEEKMKSSMKGAGMGIVGTLFAGFGLEELLG